MIQNVEKSPKSSLVPCLSRHGCRTENDRTSFSDFQKKKVNITEEACPQCGGSGRVIVSAKMELDIQPYNPKKE